MVKVHHQPHHAIVTSRRLRSIGLCAVLILLVAVLQLNYNVYNSGRDLALLTTTTATLPSSAKEEDTEKPHYGPIAVIDPTKPYFHPSYWTSQGTLHEDNYVFIGTDVSDQTHPLVETLMDIGCMLEVNHHRTRGIPEDPPKCWRSFVRRLQRLRRQRKNVIISEEWFSVQFAEFDEVGRTSVDWVALQEALSDWNVIVVVAYRRLYDILPSAKQQWDRWQPHIKALNAWPPEGRIVEPLFPNVLQDPHLGDDYIPQKTHLQGVKQWSYTDYLIKSVGRYFTIKILDFHRGYIRTSFVCEMLEGATNSCIRSRQMDRAGEESKANPEQSLYYDALVTKAAEMGWVDTDVYGRRETTVQLMTYWEETLGRDPRELDVICPPDDQLEFILERSLAKERKIMPHLSEDDHRAGFEEAKWKKKFCWVDAEKALMRREIRHFFQHLDSTRARRQKSRLRRRLYYPY